MKIAVRLTHPINQGKWYYTIVNLPESGRFRLQHIIITIAEKKYKVMISDVDGTIADPTLSQDMTGSERVGLLVIPVLLKDGLPEETQDEIARGLEYDSLWEEYDF